MSEREYDPLRDEVLRDIALGGAAYRNECRSMAKELLERRAKDAKPAEPQYDWAGMFTP